MRRIAHVINPVVIGKESDLFVAQPVTFETIKIAQEFAQGQAEIELYAAQYPEDRSIAPAGFHTLPDLDRSVLNCGTFQKRRKLPLIKDILDRLYQATEADYLIYTNVDIALMPYFYIAVNHLIAQGYDAFIVNRRTISKSYQHPRDIPLMYAQVGEKHRGHDCFVFKRDVYPCYRLGTTCIGIDRVGAVLAVNLIYNAARFKEFRNLHLTFHIGNDKVWKSPQLTDYVLHNESELEKVLAHYDVLQNPLDYPIIRQLVRRYGPQSASERARRAYRRVANKVKQWFAIPRSWFTSSRAGRRNKVQ